MESPKQNVKSVQSLLKIPERRQNNIACVVLVSLMLTVNMEMSAGYYRCITDNEYMTKKTLYLLQLKPLHGTGLFPYPLNTSKTEVF